jgi:transposase InsO family protein
LRISSAEEQNYYVFAAVRNTLDESVSAYFKLITDPKNTFSQADNSLKLSIIDYTSLAFGKRCREAGVRASIGSVGDCFDNPLYESFFATLECELLDRETFRTPDEARQVAFAFIENWDNLHHLHSTLGYASPIQFE